MRIPAAAVFFLALLFDSCTSPAPNPAKAQDWFRLTFGPTDAEPADWSGSLQVPSGRITHLSPWRFDKDDTLDVPGATWKCHTRRAETPIPEDWFVGALHVIPTEKKRAVGPLVPNGLYFGVEGANEVKIQTAQGSASFAPSQVAFGAPLLLLNGRVAVERSAAAVNLTARDGMEDDYPAAAGGWIAWTAYKAEKEELIVSRPDGSGRQSIAEGEFFRPFLAAGGGRTHLLVSVHTSDTWKIGMVTEQNGKWGRLELISEGGPDLMPRAVADSNGHLRVVWQGFRDGRSQVLSRAWNGREWLDSVIVSNNRSNAWEPAIAADSQGQIHVVWDAYDDGVYNVYYRGQRGGVFQAQRRLAPSPAFQAHAAITVDSSGHVWVAWDESGPNWGKDTGFVLKSNTGTMLYDGRQLRVVKLGGAGLESAPPLPAGFFEQAQLAADKQGNVWCLVRRRDAKLHAVYSQSLKRDRLQQYSIWDHAVLRLSESGWTAPITLTNSAGRNDHRAAISVESEGAVLAAWSGDGRLYAKPYPYVKNEVYAARLLSAPPSGAIRATAWAPAAVAVRPVHPAEAGHIERIRKERIQTQGKSLRILRGDMHRHTDLSFDGDLDGSLWDFYRYTIDAAGFDYSAVTEHNAGDDMEYIWWLVQKSNDLFHYPGRFTPVYAYERSLRYPNGHRNLVWAKRGVRSLVRSKQEEDGVEGAARLYEYLRKTGGLAMSHTSGTLMGTDWRDNDQNLEPLVEIYQGDRTSYEHEGGPRAAKGSDPLTQPGGFRREGFVWNAWAKGYKLGVQASSDHASTHISYAVLLAEGASREEILDAIRARHAYAATDNILLDVRSGDHIQGDIFTSAARPKISIRVEGTAPVDRVEIIRNNQFVFSTRPGKASVKIDFEDGNPAAGESYYYVRVLQRDGQIAWSSPMWMRRP